MKPVNQISPHDPPNSWGDCTRACVASIFELAAENVPHFAELGNCPALEDGTRPWWNNLIAWLNVRGYSAIQFEIGSAAQEWDEMFLQFHYIRGGMTRRGTSHDTVWFGRRMVHDPAHYDPVGLLDEYPQTILFIVKK